MKEENSKKTIRLLLTMLAAYLHPNQYLHANPHLQPIYLKIVDDIEVAKVEGMDIIVSKESTISDIVVIATLLVDFRNWIIETISTIVFVGTRCQNVRNCNMNNGNINVNRVKTRLIITF
jgi:hypothetical protein